MTIFNKTLIDDKSIKVSLIPNENQENVTKLGFDYECIEFNKRQIILQIEFDNPLFISQGGVDKIEIEVIDNQVFQSKDYGITVGKT